MCLLSCKKQLVLIQLRKRLQFSSATYVKAFHATEDFLYFEGIFIRSHRHQFRDPFRDIV